MINCRLKELTEMKGATQTDLNTENLVLRDIERDIVLMKEEYGIPMTDRDKKVWEELQL